MSGEDFLKSQTKAGMLVAQTYTKQAAPKKRFSASL
jgi:hypothetical protein